MAPGDNNPRVFAETITIDAWRSGFDGTSGEADLHVDVVFAEKGRVGGGDAPVRFRLSLKRAEVHVVRDSEDIIGIISSSVRRAEQPNPGKAHHTTKRESRLAGSADGSLSTTSAKLSAKASAGTSVTVTDTLEHFQAFTPMEVTHWRTDRGYGFKIAARPDGARLKGQPWDANTPLMKIRDTNTKRKRGEPPELRVEIHCLREDLLIEEIEFTSDRFPLWSALSKKKQISVEQFIKDELARAGLPCGDLSEPFTRIVIGDALPTVEP